MRKKKAEIKESHSIKTLIIYGIIVLSLIFISLMMKVYNVVRESRFDGQHRFTVAIGENEKAYGLISFEPSTSSLSMLVFENYSSISFASLNKTTGIIPDAYIKTRHNFVLEDKISSIMRSYLFNSNNISRNVTFYDLLQFWLYANKIPESTVSLAEMPITAEASAFNRTSALLFSDSLITTENMSIQIVNATGESGLGSRLERVITNLGGNVVSVITAKADEPFSKIQSEEPGTYTLQRLSSLLGWRKEKLAKDAIADIIITIGKDSKNTLLF